LYVTVRAGTRLADAQAEIASRRLWIPLATPWGESTLGGIISTNLNSPYRARYGALRDQVLGLRVVLPDGRRVRLGRPVVKNVAGYDLNKLYVGAHGTLGLITEATLRLVALPRARRSLLVPVEDLAAGLQVGRGLCRQSLLASAILLCQNSSVPGVQASPFLLVYTAEGYPQDVEAELRAARACASGVESDAVFGVDVWANSLRRAPTYLRVGVPPKALPGWMESNSTALGDTFVADLQSGIFYAAPAPGTAVTALRNAALACGGYAVIGGAGQNDSRGVWGYAPETLPLMKRLKARWDPKGCLNPGAFLV
jgi:D-lactate dehydrogenase (cytochrome)